MMDHSERDVQMYCLKWNNYEVAIQDVFSNLYHSQKFTDVSLAVSGRTFPCHKVVLSSCSTYFDEILTRHEAHNHPIIVLDLPDYIMKALITFMYIGEVEVSNDHLPTLLKVADSLRIKGLADPSAIQSLMQNIAISRASPVPLPLPERYNMHSNPNPRPTFTPSPRPSIPKGNLYPQIPTNTRIPTNPIPQLSLPNAPLHSNFVSNTEVLFHAASLAREQLYKRPKQRVGSPSPQPYKKRCKIEEERSSSVATLPPSPPISFRASPPSDASQSSPESYPTIEIKQENGEETDGELQIDESAEGGDSDALSTRGSSEANSPEPSEEESKTIKINVLTEATMQANQDHRLSLPIKMERPMKMESANGASKSPRTPCQTSHKCCEKTYTHKDLEDGIEAVIAGRLTPAKAIKQFNIPRRTFFRRLSAVRKERGIPSAKENATEYYNKNLYKKINNNSTQTSTVEKSFPTVSANNNLPQDVENPSNFGTHPFHPFNALLNLSFMHRRPQPPPPPPPKAESPTV